jgi:hypothetical protein
MKRAYIYVLCALIALAGSLASIYLSPDVPTSSVTANRLLTLDDITTALRTGGFHLLAYTGPPAASPELDGVSPQIYSDINTHGILYIYVFQSVSDRIEASGGGEGQLMVSLTSANNLFPSFYPARNVLIVYALPDQAPYFGQLTAQKQWLQSLNDITFRLNNGKVLLFRGEGDDWKAEVVYRYFEYWVPDPGGRLQYDSWNNVDPHIFYQGKDLKKVAPIQFECSFEFPAGSFGMAGTTDKNGFTDLGSGFSGNGMLIRASDTIEATIKWNGKKESFSLRCNS